MNQISRVDDESSTLVSRRQGVVRSLEAMRTGLADPMSLEYLARAAGMSRFHFVRVFHKVTGLPPFQFLSAMRLARARDLVLHTAASVTAICFDVGYTSLGTFTRRFTASVGASPVQLRRFSANRNEPSVNVRPIAAAAPSAAPRDCEAEIVVHCRGMSNDARIFVGAFPTPVPMGRPHACTTAVGTISVVLRGVPAGSHYILAVARPASSVDAGFADGEVLVGLGDPAPVSIASHGSAGESIEHPCTQEVVLQLRPVEITDPPIVSFLPLLFHEC